MDQAVAFPVSRKGLPELNPDGISVKVCSYLRTRGQAGEYAPLAANPYRDAATSAYCYVPQAIKIDRSEFNSGAVERAGFIASLGWDAKKYQALGITEQVMLVSPRMFITPETTWLTRDVIKLFKRLALTCVLTKGGNLELRDLDLFAQPAIASRHLDQPGRRIFAQAGIRRGAARRSDRRA